MEVRRHWTRLGSRMVVGNLGRLDFRTIVFALCLLLTAITAAATSYVYDGNGRLVAATNDAGQSARYVYDEVGNLQRIDRYGSGDLAIFGFSPGRGAMGTSVSIDGHGFSSTPSLNTLKFNGTLASVTSATTSRLVAAVPSGATTGPISVTIGSQTATSVIDFIVDSTALPPQITAVAPLVANVGTSITANGQRLYPITGQTAARLNSLLVVPSAITDTQLSFPVPVNAGSGRVSVTTPFGYAQSTQDILVVPAGISAAQIVDWKRLILNGPATSFAISSTGQYAAALFDNSSGAFRTLQFSEINFASLTYQIYDTKNKKIATGTVTPSEPSIHLPKAAIGGTYLLLMKPAAGPTSWKVALEADQALIQNGAAINVAATSAEQSKRVTFTAAAGQNLGLGFNDIAGTVSFVIVTEPDGEVLAGDQGGDTGGGGINITNAKSGTYTVEITQDYEAEGLNINLLLSTDIAKQIALDSVGEISLQRQGQNGWFEFSGVAGQPLRLYNLSQTTNPVGEHIGYEIYAPDGGLVTSVHTAGARATSIPNLPSTGKYRIFVDPNEGVTANTQIKLSTGSELQVGGASVSSATTTPGQDVFLTFSASAGQNLGLGITDLVIDGPNPSFSVYVLKPDGYTLASGNCNEANHGCDVNVQIPATGIYSVLVTPYGSDTASFKSILSTDVTGALTADTPLLVNISRRGQNARFTLSGTIGASAALLVNSQSTSPYTVPVTYRIYKPDGSLWLSQTVATHAALPLFNFPVSGTYTVLMDPRDGTQADAELTVSSGAVGTLVVDGSVVHVETTTVGKGAYFRFQAASGQNLGLGASTLSIQGGSADFVSIDSYKPTGAWQSGSSCRIGDLSCASDVKNAVSGTYGVLVMPAQPNQTVKLDLTLSADVAISLTRDVAAALNVPRRGQDARLVFSGNSGESLVIRVANQATIPVGRDINYVVRTPGGGYLDEMTVNTAGNLLLSAIPETGSYLVEASSYDGASFSSQVTVDTTP